MTYAPTAVYLPGLAAPQIIETLDSEAIVAAMKSDFKIRFPEYDVGDLETDPAVLIFETCAYRETLLRARINDAAKALLLAYAAETDLDHLAAFFGVARVTGETDDVFRKRVQLAPEAFSTTGSKGAYIFHALSIDPTVFDAWAWRPSAGKVEVVLAGANGTSVSDDVVAKLVDLFAREDKTPLTFRAEQNQRDLEVERRRVEALAEIDRAKTQFFANFSHEFRTNADAGPARRHEAGFCRCSASNVALPAG